MKTLEIDVNSLPMDLKIVYNGDRIKEYVLKATKFKTGVFLNKKEQATSEQERKK